ncbi:uncharacterized protein LOC144444546 isoform X2 [Glandiceps talaboti]
MALQHRLLVFTKLQSYQTAGEEVTNLIRNTLCEGSNVVVETFRANRGQGNGQHFLSTSAIVVIDARQTRSLITPERRDANVDHWDELVMLTEKVTKPKGSILVVIYGDEWSKDLGDQSLISSRWMRIWEYNDTTAFRLANQKRCFSLWTYFTTKQAQQIKDYITNEVPSYVELERLLKIDGGWTPRSGLLPTYVTELLPRSILVVGNNASFETLDKYLQINPFTVYDKQHYVNDNVQLRIYHQQLQERPRFGFKTLSSWGFNHRILRVYNVAITPTRYCEGLTDDTKQMSALLDDITRYRLPSMTKHVWNDSRALLKSVATPILKTAAYVGVSPLSFDEGLLYAHCTKCYENLARQTELPTNIFGNYAHYINKVIVLSVGNELKSPKRITGKVISRQKVQEESLRKKSRSQLENKAVEGGYYDETDGKSQTLYQQLHKKILPRAKEHDRRSLCTDFMEFIFLLCLYLFALILIYSIAAFRLTKMVCRSFIPKSK